MAELTKAQLEAKLKAANEKLAQALEVVDQLKATVDSLSSSAKEPIKDSSSDVAATKTVVVNNENTSTDVTVVWMADMPGYVKLNNAEYQFNVSGEEVILDRRTFDELVGKYHKWFENGFMAVSHLNADVAVKKRLKTDTEYALTVDVVNSLGDKSAAELEALWKTLINDTERSCFVTSFKRGFIDSKPGYRDISKISILNGLTGGSFTRELTEVTGGSLLYTPLDIDLSK